MQVYANSNRLSLKIILFFIIALFIAFLPVSSFLFFLKNDAFNGYFPPKFFMSESIHAGHVPLWNPYINFGIPQYADMSSGYWSPITWLIAATTGYNAYTLTIEVLFYILLGGIGMYKLTGLWIPDRHIRFCAGIAYMCCGYNVGHLQHFNWLSGAAFLPFCFFYYIRLLRKLSLRNVLAAVLFFYMLVASAHPGITISAFYFFVGIAVYQFCSNENQQTWKLRIKNTGRSHILFLFFLLILSAGMITSYLDILPYFVRGEKISLQDSLSNPANLQSWISYLLPFATVKNDAFYNTDPSMRNSYFGITFLLFFFLSCANKKNGWQKILLGLGMAFILLSTGGIFKTIAYRAIPFIGYVRLNGEFRIFALLSFILVAAFEMNTFVQQKHTFQGKIKWICYGIEIILVAAIIFGLYQAISRKESFIYHTASVFSQQGLNSKLKALIDAISFYDTCWLQGCMQLLFLWGTRYALKLSNWVLLKKLTVINLVIACLLNIPFTGAGKSSVAMVQNVLNKAPKGIPIPDLHPINKNDSVSLNEKGLVGDWSFYNKQPGVIQQVPYPVTLKNMQDYFEKNTSEGGTNFLNKPFVFIDPIGINTHVSVTAFSGNEVNVTAEVRDSSAEIILQQNFYPHWYYQNGSVKNKVNQAGINFMSAPLKPGKNNVIFTFEPVLVECCMLLSATSLIIILSALLILRFTKQHD